MGLAALGAGGAAQEAFGEVENWAGCAPTRRRALRRAGHWLGRARPTNHQLRARARLPLRTPSPLLALALTGAPRPPQPPSCAPLPPSRRVPGVYRVVARYGYMEEDIDHGPAFVRQLVACLVRHVTSKESGSGGAGAGDAAGTRANGAGAAANGNGAEAAGGAVGGGDPGPASGVSGRVELPTVMRGTTALAARERALSARAGGATAEGEGGGAPAPPERWSSVPVSPDGDAALDSVTGGGVVFVDGFLCATALGNDLALGLRVYTGPTPANPGSLGHPCSGL